jgi:hypothetical protein
MALDKSKWEIISLDTLFIHFHKSINNELICDASTCNGCVYLQVLVSTGNSHFRKPSPVMWDFFVKKCNQGVVVRDSS